jgi:hypothetical protein
VRLPGGRLTATLTLQGKKSVGRRLRGHVLDGSCTRLGRNVQGVSGSASNRYWVTSAGPSGRVHYRFFLDPHADYCDIGLARITVKRGRASVHELTGAPLDSIALTQKGARYLEADRLTARMFDVLTAASTVAYNSPGGRFPPAAKVVALFGPHGWQLVALRAPTDTPPTNAIGIYTDARNHAETVARTHTGRRLYIDWQNGRLATNDPEHLFRLITNQIATFIAR